MNRIIRFIAEEKEDLAAGLRGSTNEVEIRLEWYDDDSLPEVIESFRATLKQIYDTTAVLTEDEYSAMIRSMTSGEVEL